MENRQDFDVIVIGGGHAGCEAFAAAMRIGAKPAIVTPAVAGIGIQPCNPAVGGPGKGHLVREIVALGGLMGRVTDRTGIQFRTLNRRKGPAVWSTRVQTDSAAYAAEMQRIIVEIAPPGSVIEDEAVEIDFAIGHRGRRVAGVRLARRGLVAAQAIVITTGTFLRGVLFVGDRKEPGGRRGAPPSIALAESLGRAGLPFIRLKTGTCPRLDGSTIDVEGLDTQIGDEPPPFFDPDTRGFSLPQRVCHVTYTGDAAHAVVRAHLDRSALYGGAITGIGPRYCPSIETKIARFPEKERHQIFLEPEDCDGRVIYPAGLSTSLPEDAQDAMVRAIPGLERARIVRYGYAVEYDAIQPTCLTPALEVEGIAGLFLAGQILGTSGYEEAAMLGLVAGANAALSLAGDRPLELRRDRAYAGVMIDDLTGRGVDEPYRMFTSRAEHRLLLREDNAGARLVDEGERTGLLGARRAREIRARRDAVNAARERLAGEMVVPTTEVLSAIAAFGGAAIRKPTSLADLARHDGIRLPDLCAFAPWLGALEPEAIAGLEVDLKYEGYVRRQEALAATLALMDEIALPFDVDYAAIPGLRAEAIEKLSRIRPATLGQASRIPGITPATVEILHVHCRRAARSG
jgi:tRNA uridine 5-carboxymethylaminomethyl modification enzyme